MSITAYIKLSAFPKHKLYLRSVAFHVESSHIMLIHRSLDFFLPSLSMECFLCAMWRSKCRPWEARLNKVCAPWSELTWRSKCGCSENTTFLRENTAELERSVPFCCSDPQRNSNRSFAQNLWGGLCIHTFDYVIREDYEEPAVDFQRHQNIQNQDRLSRVTTKIMRA